MLNQIGVFTFITLQAEWLPVAEELIVMQRPGVDGTAFWRTGHRGKAFKVRSGVDTMGLAHGRLLFAGYKALCGSFVDLIWAGLPMTDANNRYCVLSVRPIEEVPLILGIGGESTPSLGWLEAEWELLLASSL